MKFINLRVVAEIEKITTYFTDYNTIVQNFGKRVNLCC